jgi:hypothetical protein
MIRDYNSAGERWAQYSFEGSQDIGFAAAMRIAKIRKEAMFEMISLRNLMFVHREKCLQCRVEDWRDKIA